jgi:type I restriction enzyme S subunit
MSVENLITEHLDIWTSAIKTKSAAGLGSSKKRELAGIKKLRELILELAVRGKLVPQDPDDEPASVLLKMIEAEKAQLVKEGKLKKQKPLPPIAKDEKPFELPYGWDWCRIGNFAEVKGGKRLPKGHSLVSGKTDHAYIRVTDMKDGSVKLTGLQYLANDTQKLISQYTISKKDLYITIAGTIGEVGGIPDELDGMNLTENAAKIVFNHIVLGWLKKSLSSTFVVNQFMDKMNQLAQPKLALHRILSSTLALPPLAEQHRIVTKVDELMALCDQLEAQTESSIDAHKTLVEVLLATLTDAKDAGELNDNWQTLSQHFDVLFTTQASIEQLKQTILQLAVMGKLVKQDPKDEPASKLLERITTEKQQLIKEGKIKKQKPLPPITDEEKPFEQPDGWEWVRFSFLSNEIATGPFGSMIHKSDYVKDGIPLINPSHMIESKIIEDPTIAVTKTKAEELSSYILYENDIVMARRGEMGRCALVTDREKGWLCGTGSFVLRFNSSLSRSYILLLFKTKWIKEYLGGESIGTTMTNLNHGILNKLPLLIPPLDEQDRIILQVDKLMDLCDLLKANLNQAQTTQLHLTDAIVAFGVR